MLWRRKELGVSQLGLGQSWQGTEIGYFVVGENHHPLMTSTRSCPIIEPKDLTLRALRNDKVQDIDEQDRRNLGEVRAIPDGRNEPLA